MKQLFSIAKNTISVSSKKSVCRRPKCPKETNYRAAKVLTLPLNNYSANTALQSQTVGA